MSDEAGNQAQVDLSVLSWIESAAGSSLLTYILAADRDTLPAIISGQVPLSDTQAGVVVVLSQLRTKLPDDFDAAVGANFMRSMLMVLGPNGKSIARELHNHVHDDEETPQTSDEIEASLVNLAFDSYAAFLLPSDRNFTFQVDRHGIEVTRLLINHPKNIVFKAAVEQDAVLKKVFSRQDDPRGGAYATVFRNTGMGGAIQLIALAEMLLASAWRHMDTEQLSPSSFAAQALNELRLVRDVLAGKPCKILARVGLVGVLLPSSDTRLKLPNGVVRAMTEEDRKYAPDPLKGQLTATDETGTTTVVNYDGDLLLELQYPYKVRIQNPTADGAPPSFPPDMLVSSQIEDVVLRLRSSLMFAVQRDSRAQIVVTWQDFDEPFNAVARTFSWSDPRQGTSITPLQLTEEEVTSWSEWNTRLNTAHVARIELALSRIMRAIAERREPSDVLIDSVIAWENLFGTDQGELNFRISMSLAVLLEDTYEARQTLKKRISDIYGMRSKVVHGSRNLKPDEYPKCQEALDISIQAVRALTTTRTDILALPDGARRSAALLLGNNATEEPAPQAAEE